MANGRHRVLVAEDEELIALCLEEALLDRGLQVQLARDGAEALEMAAASGPFDALLTDVRMPRITGDEVARTMMAADPELVVVIMSGDARASILAELPEPGRGGLPAQADIARRGRRQGRDLAGTPRHPPVTGHPGRPAPRPSWQ